MCENQWTRLVDTLADDDDDDNGDDNAAAAVAAADDDDDEDNDGDDYCYFKFWIIFFSKYFLYLRFGKIFHK